MAAALIAPSAASAAPGAASGDGIVPVEEPANPKCAAGLFELKYEPVVDGEKSDGTLTVKVDVKESGSGPIFDWTSNIGVDQVIVKGGPNGNSFVYDPPKEDTGDTKLHAPVNPENDKYFGLSHISFCYDIELEVTKNAKTSFTRDYDWAIEKSNSTGGETIKLSPGQTYEVTYKVTAKVVKETDSEWAVTGEITIKNPASKAAEGVQVKDVIEPGSIEAAVDCNGEAAGTGLPATIPSKGELKCTYSASLPDGTERTNIATATSTTSGIGEGKGTAKVKFGETPTKEIDECVTVTDDKTDPENPVTLGEACVGDSPKTFEYKLKFGPYDNECVTKEFKNTAKFVTNDKKETGEASSNVKIEVECIPEGGCTLTQGYWKTHSKYGPAPYDETWALVGEDTEFFDSKKSWYEAFWTPPMKGNAYWILAHQYMAAVLNGLDGASVPKAVEEAIEDAEVFLSDFDKYNGVKGKAREEMIELAGILGAYNEGESGPGHCSEDENSVQ